MISDQIQIKMERAAANRKLHMEAMKRSFEEKRRKALARERMMNQTRPIEKMCTAVDSNPLYMSSTMSRTAHPLEKCQKAVMKNSEPITSTRPSTDPKLDDSSSSGDADHHTEESQTATMQRVAPLSQVAHLKNVPSNMKGVNRESSEVHDSVNENGGDIIKVDTNDVATCSTGMQDSLDECQSIKVKRLSNDVAAPSEAERSDSDSDYTDVTDAPSDDKISNSTSVPTAQEG